MESRGNRNLLAPSGTNIGTQMMGKSIVNFLLYQMAGFGSGKILICLDMMQIPIREISPEKQTHEKHILNLGRVKNNNCPSRNLMKLMM
ncbi:hypothetical protein BDFB_014005, partial [Asbolus verrucosus]